MNNMPTFVMSVLWSYDTNKIDTELHKKIIISQVLNVGNSESTDWLFKYYGKDTVAKVAQSVPAGQWDKKSLNYWSLRLGIKPEQKMERVL